MQKFKTFSFLKESWDITKKTPVFWLLGFPISLVIFGIYYNIIYFYASGLINASLGLNQQLMLLVNRLEPISVLYLGYSKLTALDFGLIQYLYLIIVLGFIFFLVWLSLVCINGLIYALNSIKKTFKGKVSLKQAILKGHDYFFEILVIHLFLKVIFLLLAFVSVGFMFLSAFYGILFLIIAILIGIFAVFLYIFFIPLMIYSLNFMIIKNLTFIKAINRSFNLIRDHLWLHLKTFLAFLGLKILLYLGLAVITTVIGLPFLMLLSVFYVNVSLAGIIISIGMWLILSFLISVAVISIFSSFYINTWSLVFVEVYQLAKKEKFFNFFKKLFHLK